MHPLRAGLAAWPPGAHRSRFLPPLGRSARAPGLLGPGQPTAPAGPQPPGLQEARTPEARRAVLRPRLPVTALRAPRVSVGVCVGGGLGSLRSYEVPVSTTGVNPPSPQAWPEQDSPPRSLPGLQVPGLTLQPSGRGPQAGSPERAPGAPRWAACRQAPRIPRRRRCVATCLAQLRK